jgi:hypothetical protein
LSCVLFSSRLLISTPFQQKLRTSTSSLGYFRDNSMCIFVRMNVYNCSKLWEAALFPVQYTEDILLEPI